MDAKNFTSRMMQLVGNRRVRGFLIGALVLAVLAVLQVNNLKQKPRMCELLANATICTSDLQRMQIALSQSGLSEYELEEHRLMVPVAHHAQYLQAVADKDAIPEELRETDKEDRPSVNPFLSRTQQLSIERAEKKHQIRDMVLRLPFVEQAWFEMDKSDSHSAFEQAEQSAVVSIRTPTNVSLSNQHVDTVKRMIGGAVAGLDTQNIVVIDLSEGFAHQEDLDPKSSLQVHYRRVAHEEQRHYETQIREILKQYPGLKVSVQVDVKPVEADMTAQTPAKVFVPPVIESAPIPTAGANSFASIESFDPEPVVVSKPVIQQVSNTTPVESVEKEVFVSIEVPQVLVHQLFGEPKIASTLSNNKVDYKTAIQNQTQAKFAKLQSEIIRKVRPILPNANFRGSTPAIAVNLIREPVVKSPLWTAKLKEFAIQNWPSAAVLIIGLMLLSIVTRKPEYVSPQDDSIESDGDVLSLNSTNAVATDTNSEVRLTKLIEKDPDAAAKVIQAWIRDAA
jgi:hypothetical protein